MGWRVPYLVLEVDGGVELGNLGVDALAHHLALARVDELAHLEHSGRRPHVALLVSSTTWREGRHVSMRSFVPIVIASKGGIGTYLHLAHRRNHRHHRGRGSHHGKTCQALCCGD